MKCKCYYCANHRQDGNRHTCMHTKNREAWGTINDPLIDHCGKFERLRVYISGPITGVKDYKFNFATAAQILESKGFEVINPAALDLGEDATWADYMRRDIAALTTAHYIKMLPGWEKSRGAVIENRLAVDLGLEVME